MKHLILSTALILTSAAANAKTMCGINSGNINGNMTYDHSIAFDQVKDQKTFLINKDGLSATAFDFQTLKTYKDWQVLDGQLVAMFNLGNGSSPTIAVARIEAPQKMPIGNAQELLKPLAITSSGLTNQQPMVLTLPSSHLSFFCMETK
jgi:hypothetical protein